MCTTKDTSSRSLLFLGAALAAAMLALPSVAPAGTAHEDATCASCHGGAPRTTARTDAACRDCHGPGTAVGWGSPVFHGDDVADCGGCHLFHDPALLLLPGNDQPVALASVGGTAASDMPTACTPCHGRGSDQLGWISPAHQAAAAWYHSSVTEVLNQSISESCLRCHDSDQELPAVLGTDWNPPRPHVEASHPFGVPARSTSRGGFGIRSTIDPRLVLVDGMIECTTCHDIFRNVDDMLVDLGSTPEFCGGCHERTTAPGLALAR